MLALVSELKTMQQAFVAALASGLVWEVLIVHCTQHYFQAVSEILNPLWWKC